MTVALRLTGIRRAFGRRPVLDGVDLEVGPRERVAIVGPNGAGKSTLLRAAAGQLRAEGQIQACGMDVRLPAARHCIGYLPQDPALYRELTAAEHMGWWARLHGADASRTTVLLREAGLGAVAHRPTAEFSRGQRQRLSLAMCLLPDPPLLLLDEPFTALDDAGRAWVEGRLARHGGAVLMALHDPAELRHAHRVLRLQGGRLTEARA